jgi:hypothetical protein
MENLVHNEPTVSAKYLRNSECYLFIYGLFNDSVDSSDYIQSNTWKIIDWVGWMEEAYFKVPGPLKSEPELLLFLTVSTDYELVLKILSCRKGTRTYM